MPTTWQAVGPRKPTSWSGSPSNPDPTRGSGKSSPCSGEDGGSSTAPPSAESHAGSSTVGAPTRRVNATRSAGVAPDRDHSLRLRAAEVLGRDRVEELAELLDLVLLLVRDDEPGFGEDRLLRVDRHARAEGERHGVARPRGHLHPAVEHELGVERAFLEVGDPDLLQPPPQACDDVLQQVV